MERPSKEDGERRTGERIWLIARSFRSRRRRGKFAQVGPFSSESCLARFLLQNAESRMFSWREGANQSSSN
jgi:hypothetical protein